MHLLDSLCEWQIINCSLVNWSLPRRMQKSCGEVQAPIKNQVKCSLRCGRVGQKDGQQIQILGNLNRCGGRRARREALFRGGAAASACGALFWEGEGCFGDRVVSALLAWTTCGCKHAKRAS